MNDLTLHEKTALGSLAALCLAALWYFPDAVALQQRSDAVPGDLGVALLGTIIVIVIVEAVYHAVVARRDDVEAVDERDRLIRARARSFSALILDVGIISVLVHIVFGSHWMTPDVQILMVVNLLVGVLLFAEAVEQGATLILYRRGG